MSPPTSTETTTLPSHTTKNNKHIYINRVETGSVNLPVGSFPTHCDSLSSITADDASRATTAWLDAFNTALAKGDFQALVADLFVPDEPYWRDHLVLSWDFHTLHSAPRISSFLTESNRGAQLTALTLDATHPPDPRRAPHETIIDDVGAITGIEAFLSVETKTGRGRGVLRLVRQGGEWRCFTLFTTLTELKGFEEPVGRRRPEGVVHGADPKRRNWKERREAEGEFEEREPAVVVMGE